MELRERVREFVDDVLARTPAVVTSKLDPAEVVRRLKAGVDSEWTFGGGKDVVGHVDEYGFRLRLRLWYRNSFQTHMSGTVMAEGRGARIEVRSGLHPFAAVFMALWLSIVGLAAAISVAALMDDAPAEPAQAIFLFVPLGMFVFGLALLLTGRWFASNERAQLIAFVERTVEGRRAI